MKRFALLGVILAGGLAFGVYQMMHSAPSESTMPRTTERQGPTDSTASATTPSAPSGGDATPPSATAGEPAAAPPTANASEPHSTRVFKERTPVGSATEDTPEARQRAMDLRVQRAACQAPGFDHRYRILDSAGRAKLEARCLEAGVVLAHPK